VAVLALDGWPRSQIRGMEADAMSTEIQNRITGIVGVKGSGKSTAFAALLRRRERLVLWDSLGEHSWVPNCCESLETLRAFLQWSRSRERFASSYIPSGDLQEEIEEVAGMVYARGDLAFGIEELPLVCQPSYIPPMLGKLIRTGRHRQIDVVWSAQRAGEVARLVTAQTDEFVLFSQREPRDLDAIADRCGRDVAERVAALGLHGHFRWDAVNRAVVEVVARP
jgi:hypothetical protein